MTEVFVADACRTPVGKPGGSLALVRPNDLAAHVLTAILGCSRASTRREMRWLPGSSPPP